MYAWSALALIRRCAYDVMWLIGRVGEECNGSLGGLEERCGLGKGGCGVGGKGKKNEWSGDV